MIYKGGLVSVTFKVKKINPAATLPTRATSQSAGYDLYACINAPVTIAPNTIAKIPTGISIEIEPDYAAFVFARSGLAIKNGIAPANAVGLIDADYRGEIIVGLINHLNTPYTVLPNDRIAQLVLMRVFTPEITECDHLSDTQRSAGGFGSTGK